MPCLSNACFSDSCCVADDSSSGQEHFSSDHSGWSSDDSREGSDEDSCTSEYESDEDVIIESEDEVVEQASILADKGDQKSVTPSSTTTPTPASHSSAAVAPTPTAGTNEPLAAISLDPKPNSACSPPAISALEHLKLITISDGSGGEKQQQQQQQQPSSPSLGRHEQHKSLPASFIPTMKAVSVDSSDGVTACVGLAPPSSLLAAVCVLTAWLRAESVAKGTIVWCDAKSNNKGEVGDDGEANSSAGQVESSRVLWKALVAYCNLICVNLRQLSSTVNLDQLLPNLEDFVLQCQQHNLTAGEKIFNNSILHHDCFVLPEDDFLKSTIPSVVPQHVLQQPPGVQCPHVAPYLHHVGVTKANYLKPFSQTPPTISDEMNKLWLSEPCHNGVVSSKTPIARGGWSLINAFEESLLRSLRVRNDLRLLSKFEECPVQYCEETGLFSVLPRAGCAQSSASSSTAGSGSNSNNCNPYFLKKVSFGGYVMDKLVRHRTRPRTEERRPANSGREKGRKPRFRERGRPSKNRRMPNSGGRRNLYPDGGQEFSRKTGYGRRRRDFTSEESLRAGGRLGSERQNGRREDKSLKYIQPTEADDSVEGVVRLSDKRSRVAAKFDGHNRVSSGVTVLSEAASLGNKPDDSNEIFGLEDLKDAPLISPDTTSPTNGKFGAIGDRRKATTAVAADGSNVGGCAALSTIATPSGETVGEGTSDDNEAAKKFRRDHGQRMLTARWLRHKLDTTDSKPMMYLVPDASAIVYHLDTIKSIVQQRQTVVVVPMQVLSDIDEAKRTESAARDASRWLDRVLLGRGDRVSRNATLRLQGTAERVAMPGVQCPPKHHKTAWRWFQILECCHHLSRLEYFPKIGASEEAPTTKAAGRGVGSLYSDKQQQPTVLKNKHKSSLSQHKSPAVVLSSGLSLVPKAEDDNLMDRTAVVTLLTAETGDTISKLPFQLGLLASRVAAKLVFVSDYKKTQTLSHGQT